MEEDDSTELIAGDQATPVGQKETIETGEPVRAAPATAATSALPSLESLLERVAPATSAALTEHLHARFFHVRKLKPGEMR